uniref:Bromodomain containing 8 n=1 Tax=Oryzias sinensis TaxID=183150 RepID=A0A8C7YG71_9TELE
MASGAGKHKLLVIGPTEPWTVREKLCLATSVMKSGDQNWVSVSRAIKPFAEPGRPPDWFSQKVCQNLTSHPEKNKKNILLAVLTHHALFLDPHSTAPPSTRSSWKQLRHQRGSVVRKVRWWRRLRM